jgi:hypothetical protein
LVGAGLLWLYFSTRLPFGIEAKSGTDSWMPWISLAGAAASLLTGITTLSLKVIEIRSKLSRAQAKGH